MSAAVPGVGMMVTAYGTASDCAESTAEGGTVISSVSGDEMSYAGSRGSVTRTVCALMRVTCSARSAGRTMLFQPVEAFCSEVRPLSSWSVPGQG